MDKLKINCQSNTVFIPMEVLKQENVMSTNRAHFGMLCVLAGFTTGFAC